MKPAEGSAVPESDIENGCIGPVALDPGEGLRDPVEGTDDLQPGSREGGHERQVGEQFPLEYQDTRLSARSIGCG
jgi:hypothetical protein